MALQPVSITVSGFVEKGFAQARSSGYPTANLTLSEPPDILEGIYCARTKLPGNDESIPSIVFYGIPHSLPGAVHPRFEVHIFDNDANLYGQGLTVELVAFVRENKKFETMEQLHSAIENDVAIAREYFKELSILCLAEL
ncbi:riboflavin kinase [Candidatus Uhrbacteria bacterium]|nr:riboflavin kinase [Candidatus Uhrbacteria bacterium]